MYFPGGAKLLRRALGFSGTPSCPHTPPVASTPPPSALAHGFPQACLPRQQRAMAYVDEHKSHLTEETTPLASPPTHPECNRRPRRLSGEAWQRSGCLRPRAEARARLTLLSLPPAAAAAGVPPRLLQLLEVLKGSLGDVKSRVDPPEAGLPDQRQAAQSQVGVEGV